MKLTNSALEGKVCCFSLAASLVVKDICKQAAGREVVILPAGMPESARLYLVPSPVLVC
jgi:hypothetical protein